MDYSIRRRIANDDLTYDEAADLEETEVETPEALLVLGLLVPPSDAIGGVRTQSRQDGRTPDPCPTFGTDDGRISRVASGNRVDLARSNII